MPEALGPADSHPADVSLAREFAMSLTQDIAALLATARDLDSRLRPAADPEREPPHAFLDDPLDGLAEVLKSAEHASAALARNLQAAHLYAERLLDT